MTSTKSSGSSQNASKSPSSFSSSRVLIFVVAVAAALAFRYMWKEQEPDVCGLIFANVSPSSPVAYAGDAQYVKNVHAHSPLNIKAAKCSVEAGTTEDVAAILGILGAHRTPFAIKSGGHHHIPGFSSTSGVLVMMTRFSEVVYDAESQTAVVGAGLTWGEVYSALEPYGVTAVGARVSEVGVSGFILGGGYSYLTNQYGLTLDNVVAFELVKPDGHVTNVTLESDPDLFFGLRGGYNNFGVVTRFMLKTYPLGPIWGGTITYAPDKVDQFTAALAKYSAEVSDPKASVGGLYNFVQGKFHATVIVFYNGPEPPHGIFDSFLKIPSIARDTRTQEYITMVSHVVVAPPGHRCMITTIPIPRYTPKLLGTIRNETEFWGAKLAHKSPFFISYVAEPFLSNITRPEGYSPSAYPFDRTYGFTPLAIYYSWDDAQYDEEYFDAIRESERRITQAAIDDGQDIASAPRYPNYARLDMPLEAMYGGNLERLRRLRRRVDPADVMGLTGGFKF